ncbi:MAG: acyl-CoA synthetase [Myxococcales bacterium]|nr:acyl-CoA synthetase [Myxococcales bacterium]
MQFDLVRVHDTIARTLPDREAIVWRDRRLTHAQVADRSRRLARVLLDHGVTVHRERESLAGHEVGQDRIGLYLRNGNEYLEGMLGAWRARAAPFNVNYRYVDEELLYLFENAGARAIVYHASFAPRIAAIRDRLPALELLIQVADESGEPLLEGALDYEQALAAASDAPHGVEPSPDDLYILYTGGTTGMPKGVLWRGADIFMTAFGGRAFDGSTVESYEALAERVAKAPPIRALIGPPLMHGAAQWGTFSTWNSGGTVVFPDETDRLDAKDLLSVVERERCVTISAVGDAFARPLIDEIERGDYDLSGLAAYSNGGAPLSAKNKARILELLPHVIVIDGIGSSEGGVQGASATTKGGAVESGSFKPTAGGVVVSEDLSRVLPSDSTELGWFAQKGYVPLGYLGDAEKTRRTFPVIEGARFAVPGDRARYRADGTIEVLGRDSQTINSGGEKIFAEEVESAVKAHPDVFDAVVTGRPSERWGQEVVAIVQLREGAAADPEALREEAARHIARYKLPKDFVFRPKIERSPSGKADYRWAKAQAEAGAEAGQ